MTGKPVQAKKPKLKIPALAGGFRQSLPSVRLHERARRDRELARLYPDDDR